jgi:hypothetical protein
MAAISPQAPVAPAPSQSFPQEPAQPSAPQGDGPAILAPDAGDSLEAEIAAAVDEAYGPPDPDGESSESEGVRKGGEVSNEPNPLAEKEAQGPKEPPKPDASDTVKPNALATFHRQQREFQAERQAFAQEKAELAKTKALIDNAKVDRIAALEAMGYTGQDAIKQFLSGLAEDNGRMTPERRELLELKKWRETQEEAQKAQQEQWQQQQQHAQIQAKLDQIRVNVQNRLKSPDFEGSVVSLAGSDQQVMEEMDRMATESGTMPDINVAIKSVEKRFTSILEEMAKNPAAQKFFAERLSQSKSGHTDTAQSKQREMPKTIGRDARSPGTHIAPESSSGDDFDKELDEAAKWLNRVTRR